MKNSKKIILKIIIITFEIGKSYSKISTSVLNSYNIQNKFSTLFNKHETSFEPSTNNTLHPK